MAARSLEEQLAYGLKYFKVNPESVGSPQWDLFAQKVLRPWSDQQLEKVPAADRPLVEKALKDCGGYLIKIEDRPSA